MLRPGNVAASRDSSRRLGARRGPVALLLLAALAPATAVLQRAPQPVFTELFAYDPAVPSQLLGKWLGVVEDPSGKTVGRVTVHDGDGLDNASAAMLQARSSWLMSRKIKMRSVNQITT
jgi:hypothetical protein